MGLKFNPMLGVLEESGSNIVRDSVDIYANLPDPATVSPNDLYFVQNSTGLLWAKKRAGFYKSNGTDWVFATEDYLKDSFETVSKNLRASGSTLTYDANGNLDTVTYGNGVIKTMDYYPSGELFTVTLSGATPSGINLTKSFSYTAGLLTSVGYY